MSKKKPLLKVNILTLFPEFIDQACSYSILKRAREKNIFLPNIVNIRDFTRDKHRTVDDKPYGGGSGMVLKVEPLARALYNLRKTTAMGKVILLSPTGKVFKHNKAKKLAKAKEFTLLCGHYEGVDQRVVDKLCDEEISIGDYVLTGGEIAAGVIIDAVVRLLPGVLGDKDSNIFESFAHGLLDYPTYTRPLTYKRWRVPEVLISGNHKKIQLWRRQKQLEITRQKRPDLLKKDNT